MTKEKFIWLLNNSVKINTVQYTDSIFYYMDHMIERKIKLNNILDNNKTIILNNIDKDKILFEQDKKNKRLWVNYNEIWVKLKSNIEYKDVDIWDLIDDWLNDDTNWNHYRIEMGNTNWKYYRTSIAHTLSKKLDAKLYL